MSLKRLLPLLLAGAIGLSGGGNRIGVAVAQEPEGGLVEISTDLNGARDLARQALATGRPDLAASIARQILTVAPLDPTAHMLLAAALTRSGEPNQAIPVAKAGFRLAEGKAARFEGAYLTAEAMAAAGRPWRSKLWLRKADLYAPTDQHEAVLAQAYQTVSAQSRFGFAVAAFGGPSDNVNGGSLHDTFWFGSIPIPITQALPGQVWGTSAQVGYRLDERTQGRLAWAHKEVWLSDKAKALDPLARAEDYRQDELTFGLSHVWQSQDGRFAVLGSGSVARQWTGGAISANVTRTGLEMRHAPRADWVVSGKLDLELAELPQNPVADSLTSRLSLSASHVDARLGALTLGVGAVEVDSDAAGIAWRGPALTLGWRPPIRSDKVGLTLDLAMERRDYWQTPTFDADLWANLSVTAELPVLEVMGFNPTVTVSAARTRSDVVVRDTQELGVSFGLSSSF